MGGFKASECWILDARGSGSSWSRGRFNSGRGVGSRSCVSCRCWRCCWRFSHWGGFRNRCRCFSHWGWSAGRVRRRCFDCGGAVYVNSGRWARVGGKDEVTNRQQCECNNDADKPAGSVAFAGIDCAVAVVAIDSITFWGSHFLLLASEILAEERDRFAESSLFRDHNAQTIVAVKRLIEIKVLYWCLKGPDFWIFRPSLKFCR